MSKQSRSEHTKLDLVRAAAELFDRNGFAGSTLEDVSRAAGVTKGAFYFHFSSKDELGGAIQAEACAMLHALTTRLTAAESSALQVLIDLTHTLAEWLDSEPMIRASFRTARECGHRGSPFLDFYLDFLSIVDDLLRRAEAAGELRHGVTNPAVSTLAVTVCVGIEVLWWAGVRQGPVRDSLTGIWDLVLPGVAADSQRDLLRTSGSSAVRG